MEQGLSGKFSYIATVVDVRECEASVNVYLIYDGETLRYNFKRVRRMVAKGSEEHKLIGNLRAGDKVMACPEENHQINGVKHKCFIMRKINLSQTKQ